MIMLLEEHDAAIVMLAYAVAAVSAYAAFALIERLLTTKRMVWLFLGAASLGFGIWSMHFIAMVAHHIHEAYDLWMTVASMIVSLAASFISFVLIGLAKHGWGYIFVSSAILGIGASVMHYVGSSAILGVVVSYDPVMVGVTHLVGMIDALVVFTIAYRWNHLIRKRINKILCSVVMGVGMLGLHFIAVMGTTYSDVSASHATALQQEWLGGTIFFVALLILALALTCISVDKRLEAHELKYKPLFEGNPDAILLINQQGFILHGNAAVSRILGYDPKEYTLRHISEWIEPMCIRQVEDILMQTREGRMLQAEISFINKTGRVVILKVYTIPRIAERDQQAIYLIGKDITGSKKDIANLVKRHEIERKQQEIKFQTVVESVLDAVIVTDRDMNIVVWNQGAERIFGYKSEEVNGKNIDFIVPEQYLDKHRAGVRKYHSARETQILGKVVELEGRRKGGELFPLELSLNTWTADDQIYFSAIIRDISERKQAEAALLRSEEMYRNLIECFPEAIMIGRGSQWLYVNAAGVRLLGGTEPGEILSSSVFDRVHPDYHQNIRKRIQLTEKQGLSTERAEEKWIRLDGKLLQVEVAAIPAVFHNEVARIVVVRDISELKKAREIYERSEKLTVAGELAAGIAHEIRNPLTAIKGFLQLTKKEMNQAYYAIIASELQRIELIISELLMVAKPQQTSFSQERVQAIVQHVVTLMEPQAHLNNVFIEIDLPLEDIWIYCDENQIKQVMINMLRNSIEAMEAGGDISIRVEKELSTAVKIMIHDEGSGIPQDKIPNLGQPFYTTKDKGTGLGLMVSFNIIRNHQGHVSIQSEMGEGTTFIITLPVVDKVDEVTSLVP